MRCVRSLAILVVILATVGGSGTEAREDPAAHDWSHLGETGFRVEVTVDPGTHEQALVDAIELRLRSAGLRSAREALSLPGYVVRATVFVVDAPDNSGQSYYHVSVELGAVVRCEAGGSHGTVVYAVPQTMGYGARQKLGSTLRDVVVAATDEVANQILKNRPDLRVEAEKKPG